MTRKPRIPMRPSELPQQRLYLVRGQVIRPAGWASTTEQATTGIDLPAAMPRTARYLGQVEWAWSPMNMRIDAYYLSMDRPHRRWVLWGKPYDDNWGQWDAPTSIICGPRIGLTAPDAARLLLLDYWATQRDDGTDRFHWINEEGLFNAGDFNAVAEAVWQAEGRDDSVGTGS